MEEVQVRVPEGKAVRYRDIDCSLQNEYRYGVWGRRKNEDKE